MMHKKASKLFAEDKQSRTWITGTMLCGLRRPHTSKSKGNLWGILKQWRRARSLTSSEMSSWRSGRGLQWQPVKLLWTPCQRGLRQCWKIMVATLNINTFGPIWTFSLRGVLNFVASSLDINGCVSSYFEWTAYLHCYTSSTLHSSKVSLLQCCHMKIYNTIFTKCEGCTHFSEILYYI